MTENAARVGDLRAHLAVPRGGGPWPGLVLVHEAFGLDEVMVRSAQRLASLGYLVLAPDLLSRGRRLACLAATFAALRRGSGPAFDDLDAARRQLIDDPRCSGRVGVIGFCLGGGFALALAGRPGWDASSVNYGMLPRDLTALEGACPVVASYGARDRSLRGSAERLRITLRENGVPHDVVEYPHAGHSFLNDTDNAPWWAAPVSRLVTRAGPEPESARDAWRRIDTFLRAHLT
ncbi:MAG: dienelactone hydrolase family protein [Dermatophilaceae bacterium]